MEQKEIFGTLWIFCIVGGSGVGKTTMAKRLLEQYPDDATFSVSATTRPPGRGEIDGKDYYYFSNRQFKELEEKKGFIETNPFATGHRYGTLVSEFERARKENKVLIVDCEITGAEAIFEQYPGHTVCMFLDATNETAEARLMGASTRKRDNIPNRIKDLEEQRVIAEKSKAIKLVFDSTRMSESLVSSVVNNLFLEELNIRKSVLIS